MNTDGTVKSEQQISPAVGGLTGVGPADEFGTSVSPIGDLDGDGVPDLVVGSILGPCATRRQLDPMARNRATGLAFSSAARRVSPRSTNISARRSQSCSQPCGQSLPNEDFRDP